MADTTASPEHFFYHCFCVYFANKRNQANHIEDTFDMPDKGTWYQYKIRNAQRNVQIKIIILCLQQL